MFANRNKCAASKKKNFKISFFNSTFYQYYVNDKF